MLKCQWWNIHCHIKVLKVLKKNTYQSQKCRSLIQSWGRYFCRQQCVLSPSSATDANGSYSWPYLLLYKKIKRRGTDVTSCYMLRHWVHKYIKWNIDQHDYRLAHIDSGRAATLSSFFSLQHSLFSMFIFPSPFLLVLSSVSFWNPLTFILP